MELSGDFVSYIRGKVTGDKAKEILAATKRELSVLINAAKAEERKVLNREKVGTIAEFEAAADALLSAKKIESGFVQVTRSLDVTPVKREPGNPDGWLEDHHFSTVFRVWLCDGKKAADAENADLTKAAQDACDRAGIPLPGTWKK